MLFRCGWICVRPRHVCHWSMVRCIYKVAISIQKCSLKFLEFYVCSIKSNKDFVQYFLCLIIFFHFPVDFFLLYFIKKKNLLYNRLGGKNPNPKTQLSGTILFFVTSYESIILSNKNKTKKCENIQLVLHHRKLREASDRMHMGSVTKKKKNS